VDVGFRGAHFQDPGADLPFLFFYELLNPTYVIAPGDKLKEGVIRNPTDPLK
jgi:hypothetical protein